MAFFTKSRKKKNNEGEKREILSNGGMKKANRAAEGLLSVYRAARGAQIWLSQRSKKEEERGSP